MYVLGHVKKHGQHNVVLPIMQTEFGTARSSSFRLEDSEAQNPEVPVNDVKCGGEPEAPICKE